MIHDDGQSYDHGVKYLLMTFSVCLDNFVSALAAFLRVCSGAPWLDEYTKTARAARYAVLILTEGFNGAALEAAVENLSR